MNKYPGSGPEMNNPITRLNDRLRTQRIGGRIMTTSGISALGSQALTNILSAIAGFDAFTPANDPYGEHDCAVMAIDGHDVLWKIDYYDETLSAHSPDPADPNVTVRVMTVMLAEEY
jgi:hypothetical protein